MAAPAKVQGACDHADPQYCRLHPPYHSAHVPLGAHDWPALPSKLDPPSLPHSAIAGRMAAGACLPLLWECVICLR